MTVKRIIKEMNGNKLNFDFSIQRDSGQWTNAQKSLFISSVLEGYDIPDIYIICSSTENYEKNSVIDGKQRCTTLKEFYDGKFKLSRKTENIVVDGVEYRIAGKAYKDLPEELVDEFLDYVIYAKKLDSYTDKQIEEQFYRLNNGSTFTTAQKANVKLGNDLSQKISVIANGSFLSNKASMSERQVKSGENMSCVLQTLMLMMDFDYRSMSNSEVLRFASYINDLYDNGEFDTAIIDECKNTYFTINILLDGIDVSGVLKKVHIPALVYVINDLLKEDEAYLDSDFKGFLKYWIETGINSDDYRETCGNGSTHKNMVKARIEVIRKHFTNFITK